MRPPVIALWIVVSLVVIALWLWMARESGQGRNWARILSTVAAPGWDGVGARAGLVKA